MKILSYCKIRSLSVHCLAVMLQRSICIYCMRNRIMCHKCRLTRRCDCTWWCGRLFGWGVGMCAPWWYTDTGSCFSCIGVPALCFPKSAAKASALESMPSWKPLFKPLNKSPWNTEHIMYQCEWNIKVISSSYLNFLFLFSIFYKIRYN